MTTCSDIRELLLEASPAELGGEGDGPLAAHLRECALCRRRAARLLEADEALDAALGAPGTLDVEAVLERAARLPSVHLVSTWGARAGSAARRALSARRAWVPLAAAAAVAGLLLVARSPAPPPLPAVAHAEAPPLVEESSAGGVAIIETDNPDITVLWFFEQGA